MLYLCICNVIVVGLGKGGVGKFIMVVNLVVVLVCLGVCVGFLDVDIYGFSVLMMFGLSGCLESLDNKLIELLCVFGVEIMFIGYLIEDEMLMIWCGLMVMLVMMQFFNDMLWDDLDYLLIDLLLGIGDIQLMLIQKILLVGVVIVIMLQDIVMLDVKKVLKMFEKVEVLVLGLVENMVVYICSNCGYVEYLFGQGGGECMVVQYGVLLFGLLLLDIGIWEQGDVGILIVVVVLDLLVVQVYLWVVEWLVEEMGKCLWVSILILFLLF